MDKEVERRHRKLLAEREKAIASGKAVFIDWEVAKRQLRARAKAISATEVKKRWAEFEKNPVAIEASEMHKRAMRRYKIKPRRKTPSS